MATAWFLEIPVVTRSYLAASVATTALCALDIISPFRCPPQPAPHARAARAQRAVPPTHTMRAQRRRLYLNVELVIYRYQLWRLITNFLFFGMLSMDFAFHMFFLVRYSRLLEEGSFRGETADATAASAGTLSPPPPLPPPPPPHRIPRLRLPKNGLGRAAEYLSMLLYGAALLCCFAPFLDAPPFLGSSLVFMIVYVWGRSAIRHIYLRDVTAMHAVVMRRQSPRPDLGDLRGLDLGDVSG